MNRIIKILLILINVLMLLIAFLWIRKEQSFEPYIIALGQVGSLLVLFFEQKVSKIFVRNVSKSKVDIHTSKDDQGLIKVGGIENESDVRIKRK